MLSDAISEQLICQIFYHDYKFSTDQLLWWCILDSCHPLHSWFPSKGEILEWTLGTTLFESQHTTPALHSWGFLQQYLHKQVCHQGNRSPCNIVLITSWKIAGWVSHQKAICWTHISHDECSWSQGSWILQTTLAAGKQLFHLMTTSSFSSA